MRQRHLLQNPQEVLAQAHSRRAFMKVTAGATVVSSLLGRAEASASVGGAGAGSHPIFAPARELSARIKMTQDRLTRDGMPSFSTPFILADVSLDPAFPRRFSNYSGDLSGRYIGALALFPRAVATAQLDNLVRQLLTFQRADGRFGDADLSFVPQDIGREQMALLWGNGRLLVGLLEYNSAHPDAAVLASAKRLAHFLLGVQESCSRPEVMQRLVGQGASGFICFTQLIEAFALLGVLAGDRRYCDAAAKIIPWLQPRGNQHSHGYLTTLRGIIELHRDTGNAEQLRYVEKAYQDLLSSSDYTVYGGVYEYFGAGPGDARADERGRDEGCSEADFVRLSLQLWQATRKVEYLERAERCLLNEFFFNQFNTGDFGHHTGYRYGYRSTESVGRAWWCCTMHGLRAFRDVVDAVVTSEGDTVRINLFLDGTWSGKPLLLDLTESESTNQGDPPRFRIIVRESSSADVSVAVRRPSWASRYDLRLNGGQVAGENADGYSVVRRRWKKGDVLEAGMEYGLRLLTRSGRSLSQAEVGTQPIEAAVFCGPYLLAADSANEPGFFGEPWMGDNPADSNMILLSGAIDQGRQSAGSATRLARLSAHRRFEYVHGGWPDKQQVILRPISEQTSSDAQALAVWLRFRRA